MNSIFVLPEYNEQINRQGYVILDLLNSDEVNTLKDMYHQYDEDQPDKFYCSNYITDPEKRAVESASITNYIFPRLQKHLSDYKPLFGAFITKRPGRMGKVHPHQDWQFVDETKFSDLNVWIPLGNTNLFNGALSVFPGSHTGNDKLRGPNLDYNPGWKELQQFQKKTLYMKAGQAVIYPTSLVHTSTGNFSFKKRLAVNMIVIPRMAEPIYVYKDVSTANVKVYDVPADFYVKHCNFKPGGKNWELSSLLK